MTSKSEMASDQLGSGDLHQTRHKPESSPATHNCILCETFGNPFSHPAHPEARGMRIHDYEGLRREIDLDAVHAAKKKSEIRGRCTGKQKLSESRAERAAKRLGEYRSTDFNCYRCASCRMWHVGKADRVG